MVLKRSRLCGAGTPAARRQHQCSFVGKRWEPWVPLFSRVFGARIGGFPGRARRSEYPLQTGRVSARCW